MSQAPVRAQTILMHKTLISTWDDLRALINLIFLMSLSRTPPMPHYVYTILRWTKSDSCCTEYWKVPLQEKNTDLRSGYRLRLIALSPSMSVINKQHHFFDKHHFSKGLSLSILFVIFTHNKVKKPIDDFLYHNFCYTTQLHHY